MATAFSRVTAAKERQLTVSFRTRYDADDDLLLGRSLETAWQLLTGAPPVGWGTAELVNLPWSTRQLTDLARSRVPEPTLLTAVGDPDRPAIANARITRTTAGSRGTSLLRWATDRARPWRSTPPWSPSTASPQCSPPSARPGAIWPSLHTSSRHPSRSPSRSARTRSPTQLLPTLAAPRSLSAPSSSAPPRTRPSTMSWATGRTLRRGARSMTDPAPEGGD